jgi:hypothetical protein
MSVLTDSTYYIDPNGGSKRDALEVVCRKMELFPGWFSCVNPTVANMQFTGEECKHQSTKSLMACKNKRHFEYGGLGRATHQLASLAYMSDFAMQSIVTSCSESSQPTTIHSWNGREIKIKDLRMNRLTLEAKMDCRNSGNSNTYTVLTTLPHALPVADLDADIPGDESLSVSLGEVCYS